MFRVPLPEQSGVLGYREMAQIGLQAGVEPYPGYILREKRGQGGYAEVWEASAPDDSLVALKFISGVDRHSAPREIRAIQAVRQLTHPHLIPIEQVWCWKSFIVISMELAEGSLLDLLDAYMNEFKSGMVAEHVCVLLAQAANALDFLNTRQHVIEGKTVAIQHCDIKPSNLLLFGDVVKLTDYGLSSVTVSKVQPHRRAGTLDYAAPEVFQGRLSDHTDQYALAVSYCQLRSGRLPFPNTPKTFERRYVRPTPDLTMLTEGERPIIARGLSHAPQDRWASCSEMIAELSRVTHEHIPPV